MLRCHRDICHQRYDLQDKREAGCDRYARAEIRIAAKQILALDEKSVARIIQGDALSSRMICTRLLLRGREESRSCRGFDQRQDYARILIRQRRFLDDRILDILKFTWTL